MRAIITTIAIALISVSTAFGGGTTHKAKKCISIQKEMSRKIGNASLAQKGIDESNVVVTFIIKEDRSMHILDVEGESGYLKRLVKSKLENSLTRTNLEGGKPFQISIRFLLKA